MVKMECKRLLLVLMMVDCVMGFTHIVGGRFGWRVPRNLTFFDEWAKPRTFGVGDRLVFPSRPCGNNVVWVGKDDYEHCTQNNITKAFYEGPLVLNLTQTGDYYFYSGVGKHCEAGHKLHINVGDKQGFSGDDHPFKYFDGDTLSNYTVNASSPDAASKLQHSSATAIHSVFTSSLLLTCYFFLSLFFI
ncbi:umecyanin-like [Cannabis sativa]|uniref:Phytocyanin domain-containing protein n=1 Tax=Cannabis sativa TaxID=3483 RepID=A0A7J6H2N0_CANSA|nr:umecyanin-like [Cannabis sativa]KAF4389355.1 hypothetical protein G4B88_006414 [Cannabis sativa]